jgi:murein DD-endopeptidase MepM/ murein hydrolase activator NlpD
MDEKTAGSGRNQRPRAAEEGGRGATPGRKEPGRILALAILTAMILAGGVALGLNLGRTSRPVSGPALRTRTAAIRGAAAGGRTGHRTPSGHGATALVQDYYPPLGEATPPVSGPVMTGFGWVYSKTLGAYAYHPGWAFKASLGEPVRAVLGGRVVANWVDPTEGREAVVDSRNGDSLIYGDLAGQGPNVGTRLSAGQVFAHVGPVGVLSRGEPTHLFLGVSVDGHPVSPEVLLAGKVKMAAQG